MSVIPITAHWLPPLKKPTHVTSNASGKRALLCYLAGHASSSDWLRRTRARAGVEAGGFCARHGAVCAAGESGNRTGGRDRRRLGDGVRQDRKIRPPAENRVGSHRA